MSVASILQQMAENAGRARLQRGALIGGVVSDLSQVPGQIMADRQQTAMRARQVAQQDAQAGYARNADARATADQARQDQGAAAAEKRQAVLQRGLAAGFSDDPHTFNLDKGIASVVADGVPDLALTLRDVHAKFQPTAPKPVVLKPGDVGFDEVTRQPIPGMSVPANPPAPRPLTFGAPTPVMVGGKRVLVRPGSDGGTYGMDGTKVPTTNIMPDVPPRSDNEPLVAIMGPDSKPVLVPRSQAVGKRPASTREQGRPVTSGDAGRVTDFDTSLDDVAVLRDTVSGNKATGTMAKLGTMIPNWATEITGWGEDAKSKNAVIARVKQVIGKALEGGVLRKEDEEKYKDILPTIGDVASVVASKLQGLEKAITLRRERHLENLQSADYDVTKFSARAGAPAQPPAANGPQVGERRMINGQLGEWDGKGWKAVSR